MRTFVLGLLAAVLAAGVVGVVVAGGFHSRKPAAAPPLTPSATPAPTVTGDRHLSSAELRKLVLAPPPGTHEDTFDGGDDGVFTIDQFTKNFYSQPSTAKKYLKSVGFRLAATRGWIGPDAIDIEPELLEFDTAGDAAAFFGDLLHDYGDDSNVTDTFVIDPGNGVGYEWSKLDSAGYHRAKLIAVRDNLVVQVAVFATGAYDRAEESRVLTAQVEALS